VFPPGEEASGVQDGESLKAVRARLKKDGIVVLEIQEAAKASAVRSGSWNFTTAGRVRLGDVANATRQLATLLSSGLPLMDALSLLVEQEESEGLKSALSSVRDAVRDGSSLADALKANPKAVSDLYVNMVSAGETSGTLEITLDRLSDFLDEQVRFRGKLAAALAYPALMSLIGIAVLFFLFAFVMPRVTGMFQDMDRQLPFITLMLLWIVEFLSSYWWVLVLALAGASYYVSRHFKTPAGRESLDGWLLHMPVFGGLIRMIAVSVLRAPWGRCWRAGSRRWQRSIS
jgi:general secretion pathway protein F